MSVAACGCLMTVMSVSLRAQMQLCQSCTNGGFSFHPHSGSVQMSLICGDHRDSSPRVQTCLQNHHQRGQT